jgi:hypothetical protein
MEGKREEQATIPGSEFFKSLGKLEALAKGDTPEDMEKAQLFHTKNNSEPSNWPGGDSTKYGPGWDDSIGQDGTDYHPARKAIAEKVLKGEPLTPEDISILKSDQMDKGGKEDEDEDKEKFAREKACKSITDENETLQKAIEMSPFLAEFAKAFDSRLSIMEQNYQDKLTKALNSVLENLGEYLEERFSHQGEFNKSLAEVVAGIGHGLSANIQQTAEMAQAPAGPPKSTLRSVDGGAKPIEKSFAGPAGGEALSKSQVLGAMTDMVEKSQLNPLEVIKYENTGQIRPELLDKITQTLTAAGGR